jgi:hypothetical protein
MKGASGLPIRPVSWWIVGKPGVIQIGVRGSVPRSRLCVINRKLTTSAFVGTDSQDLLKTATDTVQFLLATA